MDSSIYIFGKFDSGYTQYPDDYSQNIFHTLYDNSRANTQIAVHREGNLMYYAYIRKLDKIKYIGICIVLTGEYITDYAKLFSFFEEKIAFLAKKGKLIHYSNDGEITSNVSKLYKVDLEINNFTYQFRQDFQILEKSALILPPINFAISNQSVKTFDYDDDDVKDITLASFNYAYTYIYKDEDYDTDQITSYKAVLHRLSSDNQKLKQDNLSLAKNNKKIQRQKKQMKLVIVLILIISVSSMVFYDKLVEKNRNIEVQENTIQRKTKENNILTQKNQTLNNVHDRLLAEHGKLLSKYEALQIEKDLLQNEVHVLDSIHDVNMVAIDNLKTQLNTIYGNYSKLREQTSKTIHLKNNNIEYLQTKCRSLEQSINYFKQKFYSTREGKRELKSLN